MEKQQIKNWKFILKDEAEAWQKDFDDANWSEVQVPHDWSIHQDFSRQASTGTGSLPGGIGWYRATFPFEKNPLRPNIDWFLKEFIKILKFGSMAIMSVGVLLVMLLFLLILRIF